MKAWSSIMTFNEPTWEWRARALFKGTDSRTLFFALALQLLLYTVLSTTHSTSMFITCTLIGTIMMINLKGTTGENEKVVIHEHPGSRPSEDNGIKTSFSAPSSLTKSKYDSPQQSPIITVSQPDDDYTDSAYASRIATPSIDLYQQKADFADSELPHQRRTQPRNSEDLLLLGRVLDHKIPLHALERHTDDFYQAIRIRRTLLSSTKNTFNDCSTSLATSALPFEDYNYAQVHGRCAENVIGYMPIPVGIAGPLVINGVSYLIPLATTEGALIASTNRGAKALNTGPGIHTEILDDGMTRAPVLTFPTLSHAASVKRFLDSCKGQEILKESFDATSSHARLTSTTSRVVGSSLYLRFKASTGNAMGMNMLGKGVSAALANLPNHSHLCPALDDMTSKTLSSNLCTDKKPSAINWLLGRGKSVCAEAILPASSISSILKVTVKDLVACNVRKNLVGSALAGMSSGGYNAQAANLVAALFTALGQDTAQVVESSNCMTLMEELDNGNLKVSVTMPSVLVGTVGGGTGLEAQRSMLGLLGLSGEAEDGEEISEDGGDARRLATIVAGTVLAGEVSLMSALVSQELMTSHLALNRK
ncbi:3-hydroxy-3-methylglutaryl-coenzyme A reductase [Aureobasidium subglaciale]|nr:3-hydroxy-3-methylglutaryl-coenzyme A reductase [Aureobasidium subglaciale]